MAYEVDSGIGVGGRLAAAVPTPAAGACLPAATAGIAEPADTAPAPARSRRGRPARSARPLAIPVDGLRRARSAHPRPVLALHDVLGRAADLRRPAGDADGLRPCGAQRLALDRPGTDQRRAGGHHDPGSMGGARRRAVLPARRLRPAWRSRAARTRRRAARAAPRAAPPWTALRGDLRPGAAGRLPGGTGIGAAPRLLDLRPAGPLELRPLVHDRRGLAHDRRAAVRRPRSRHGGSPLRDLPPADRSPLLGAAPARQLPRDGGRARPAVARGLPVDDDRRRAAGAAAVPGGRRARRRARPPLPPGAPAPPRPHPPPPPL